MLRQRGQMAVHCDGCGAVFDDRPRDKSKNVVSAALLAGWMEIPVGKHLCPCCGKSTDELKEGHKND